MKMKWLAALAAGLFSFSSFAAGYSCRYSAYGKDQDLSAQGTQEFKTTYTDVYVKAKKSTDVYNLRFQFVPTDGDLVNVFFYVYGKKVMDPVTGEESAYHAGVGGDFDANQKRIMLSSGVGPGDSSLYMTCERIP